jgi:hypothetical protein
MRDETVEKIGGCLGIGCALAPTCLSLSVIDEEREERRRKRRERS